MTLPRHLAALVASAQTGVEQSTLPSAATPAAIPAARGVARAGGAGNDALSELTETPDTREYHPAHTIYSTSGLIRLVVRPVKKITFTDRNGVTRINHYDDPLD